MLGSRRFVLVVMSPRRLWFVGSGMRIIPLGNTWARSTSCLIPREKYQIRKGDEHTISLEGYTVVRKLSCPDVGFVRYPFDLMPLEDVDLNDSAYLLDVIGCVMEVGKTRTTTGGSELLDFEIMNERGTRVRVTLWAPLCNDLIKRKAGAVDPYVVIFPGMNVKEFRGDLFLSSTSATVLYDAPDIPQISSLTSILKESGTSASNIKPLFPSIILGTIYQLLRAGREQAGCRIKPITYHCHGRVQNIHIKDGWFYFSCGLGGCKKRVSRSGTKFMCQTCSKVCEFPRTSYLLHLNIADPTGTVIVTLFDEVANKLLGKTVAQLMVECEAEGADDVMPAAILALVDTSHVFEIKSSSYYDQGTYESFTVTNVINPPDDKLLPHKRSHAEMEGESDGETNIKVDDSLDDGKPGGTPILSLKSAADPDNSAEELDSEE